MLGTTGVDSVCPKPSFAALSVRQKVFLGVSGPLRVCVSLVVGHLPFLGKLASDMMLGDEMIQAVDFQQGALVCLETD